MAFVDVVGLPLADAIARLQAARIEFETEISRPTRHFFPLEEDAFYVIRQHMMTAHLCRLTVACKQRKEVSDHGIQNR